MLFGGKFVYDLQPELVAVDLPPDYIYNNFNDFASSFVTLFELIVINNWCIQVRGYSPLLLFVG